MKFTIISLCVLICSKLFHIDHAFCRNSIYSNHRGIYTLKMVDSSIISLASGSFAGAAGIGVAFPFDTLKTKAQQYAARKGVSDASSRETMSAYDIAELVMKEEGIAGFYGGVKGVMLGEAFVKATLFGSNAWALSQLVAFSHAGSPSLWHYIAAAAFSGFVSSFVLNPIDRVKILIQTNASKTKMSELSVINEVIRKDGFANLLFLGLDAMLLREIPGCIFYFLTYSLLMKYSPLPDMLGTTVSSFLSGASAGVCAWIPIYPSDVVKT